MASPHLNCHEKKPAPYKSSARGAKPLFDQVKIPLVNGIRDFTDQGIPKAYSNGQVAQVGAQVGEIDQVLEIFSSIGNRMIEEAVAIVRHDPKLEVALLQSGPFFSTSPKVPSEKIPENFENKATYENFPCLLTVTVTTLFCVFYTCNIQCLL